MSKIDFSAFWVLSREAYGAPYAGRSVRPMVVMVAVVAAAAAAILWLGAPAALPNGDAAVYAQQVESKDFQSRSVHRGYFVLMAALGGWGDGLDDLAFNRLHALFGAATVGLLALIAAYLCGAPRWGYWVLPFALGHELFVESSLWAEVYGPQGFFLVASLILMAGGRPAAAGIALALAVLITPSSLLAVPALVLVRPDLRSFLSLGLVGGGVTLLSIGPVYEDYFFGDRGLLKASGAAVDLKLAVLKEGFEVAFGFVGVLGLLALGLLALVRRPEGRPWAVVAVAWWAPHFFLGERFRDVPVQLTLWLLLIPVAVLGMDELRRWARDGADLWQGLPLPARLPRSWLRGTFLLAPAAGFAVLMPLLVVARGEVNRFANLPSWLFPALASAAAVAGVVGVGLFFRPTPRSVHLGAGIVGLLGALVGPAWVYHWVALENHEMAAYRQVVEDVVGSAAPDYRVLAGWSRGILFEHYAFGRSYTDVWINPAELSGGWGEDARGEAEDNLRRTVASGREIYWLSTDAEKQDGTQAATKVIEMLKEQGYRFEALAGGRGHRGVPGAAPVSADDEAREETQDG